MAYGVGVGYFRARAYKVIDGVTWHSPRSIAYEVETGIAGDLIAHSFAASAAVDGYLLEATASLDTGPAFKWRVCGDSLLDDNTGWTDGSPTLNLLYGYSLLNVDVDGTTYGLKTDLPASASNLSGTNTGDQDLSLYATVNRAVTTTYSGGNLTGLSYSDGSTKTLSYNGSGQLSTIVYGGTGPNFTKTLTYNGDGTLAGVAIS